MAKLVLQIEDSDDDARLTELAFRRAGVTNPILSLSSGEEALRYFTGEGIYSDRDKYPLPAALLVDMKLPGISGFELFELLIKKSMQKGILMVLISGYGEVEQLRRGYIVGAHTFLVKPLRDQDIVNLIAGFPDHWSFKES